MAPIYILIGMALMDLVLSFGIALKNFKNQKAKELWDAYINELRHPSVDTQNDVPDNVPNEATHRMSDIGDDTKWVPMQGVLDELGSAKLEGFDRIRFFIFKIKFFFVEQIPFFFQKVYWKITGKI